MGAHPHTAAGHLAVHRIQAGAVPPVVERIDPDHSPVAAEQPVACGFDRVVGIDDPLDLQPASTNAPASGCSRVRCLLG